MNSDAINYCVTFDDGPMTAIPTAKDIMGSHFVGIEEIESLLSVKPSKRQGSYLYTGIPFQQDTLRVSAGTRFLFPYIPTPIDFLRNKNPELFDANGRCIEIDDDGPLEWHLVNRLVVPRTTGCSWDTQRELILDDPNRKIISADALVFAHVAHHRLHGEFLYTEGFRRTSTFDSHGCRLAVGVFRGRISITHWGNGFISPDLSVATGIKTGT